MVEVVELDGAPFRVIDQLVPGGSPLSENVTGYVVTKVGVNVIACETASPRTITDPDDGLAVKPETGPTVYEYVPFTSVKAIVGLAELPGDLSNVIFLFVPDGSPLSVKVTA